MTMKVFPALLPLVLLAACADGGSNYSPILDGPAGPAYAGDLAECRALARNQKQFDQETLGAALLGAGVGALLGLADDDSSDLEGAAGGAVVGGLAGGAAGGINAADRRQAIVIECLRARGHRVVG